MNNLQYNGLKKIIEIANKHNLEVYDNGHHSERITDPETAIEDLEASEYLTIWFPTKIQIKEQQDQNHR